MCEKEGYLRAGGALVAETQGMTFGNLLFGGIIGLAIDAGSGAMHEYPAAITVALLPAEFESDTARDAFFDRRAADVEGNAAEAIEKMRGHCDEYNRGKCEDAVAEIESSRDAELATIETQRASAVIAAE